MNVEDVDYYVYYLSEEAAEVGQEALELVKSCQNITKVASKSLRFGLKSTNPDTLETNFEMLRNEIHDVLACYEMICETLGKNSCIVPQRIQRKKDKVKSFMNIKRSHYEK